MKRPHRLRVAGPALALLASGLAAPALAQDYQCRFETECVEGEACVETGVELRVEGFNLDRRAVTLETAEDTLRGTAINTDGAPQMIFVGDGVLHMMTIAEDGARYTVHESAPRSVTWLGNCEVAD